MGGGRGWDESGHGMKVVLDENGIGMNVVLDERGFGMKVVWDENFWDETRHFHPNLDETVPTPSRAAPTPLPQTHGTKVVWDESGHGMKVV